MRAYCFVAILFLGCGPNTARVPVLERVDLSISTSTHPYLVQPRTPVLEEGEYYPCDTCHDEGDEVNTNPRALVEDHEDLELVHGRKRFWCLTCHDVSDRNSLVLFNGERVDFDSSEKVCAQCHFRNFRDFEGGAHGKRLNAWRGERLLEACTTCHNAHSPAIKPRKPKAPPDRPRTEHENHDQGLEHE